ncbi:MFS transporter, partial [Streptomyces sp. 900116325]
TLSASIVAGIQDDPRVPDTVQEQATTELASGVPFLSDTQLSGALDAAGVDRTVADAVVSANTDARLQALQAALWVAALLTVAALFASGRIPRTSVGDDGRQP